jgi:hypothetical protein
VLFKVISVSMFKIPIDDEIVPVLFKVVSEPLFTIPSLLAEIVPALFKVVIGL